MGHLHRQPVGCKRIYCAVLFLLWIPVPRPLLHTSLTPFTQPLVFGEKRCRIELVGEETIDGIHGPSECRIMPQAPAAAACRSTLPQWGDCRCLIMYRFRLIILFYVGQDDPAVLPNRLFLVVLALRGFG